MKIFSVAECGTPFQKTNAYSASLWRKKLLVQYSSE